MPFVRHLARALWEDRIGDLAAMLTYYAIFALFPMAIFVVTVALMLVPASAVLEAATLLTGAMPEQAGVLVLDQVGRMQEAAGGGIAIGSALLAIFGASRGAGALARALNEVHDLRETRPWWLVEVIGLAVTLAVAVLLVLAISLLVIGPALGGWAADQVGGGALFATLWSVGRWVGAALLMMIIWSLLYRFLPNTREPLRVFTPGAVAAVVVWIGISLLFELYVNRLGTFERTYGALGAVLIFLAWIWLSNIVMLGGAVVNDVLHRSRRLRRIREEGPHGQGSRRPRDADRGYRQPAAG